MTYDDFMPFVAPWAPSCPTETIKHHIRQAAIEFCRNAPVWVEQLDPVTGDGTASEFVLNVDDEVSIVRLERVTTPATVYDLVPATEGWERIRCNDSRECAFTSNRSEITLHPAPADAEAITVIARLAPSINSSEFPDDLFAHYAKKISDGALAELLSMVDVEWSKPVEAERRRILFEKALSEAHVAAARGFSLHRPRVRAHFF